ncbi:hypothetical protein UlMin_014268 [Ulmus minor]
MNDSLSKTSSSLAITEKRPHRPGGCVGIFFQLFDWNRKFAKKKLFSKRLLPPARTKQASKKFKGDEKMPNSKLHLIADENSGGFPNKKRHSNRGAELDHNHETRAPGLVARLMGLESMPAMREKPKKASFTDACEMEEKKFVNSCGGYGKDDTGLEKGSTKLESRPQKLQKTGQFERRAVTRFGTDALQIKSVLSRSRKHYNHPKLVPPAKSPRMPSGKNVSRTSRLIDAATKILEPGLQSTSRAKCALTYSSSTRYPPKEEAVTERPVDNVKPEQVPKQSGCSANAAQSSMGHNSCKSCGNLLNGVHLRSNVEEGSCVLPSLGTSSINGSSFGQQTNAVSLRSWDEAATLAARKEEMDNVQSNSKPITERTSVPHEGQGPWQLSSQPFSESCTFTSRHSPQMQDRMPIGRDTTPPRPKLNNLQSRRVSSAANAVRGTKDFVALNRSLSGQIRPRVPTKLESPKFEPERKAINVRDEGLPQLRSSVRKRRTINVSNQVESRAFVSSAATKQRNIQYDSLQGKGARLNAHTINQICVKSKLAGPRDGSRASNSSGNDVISFTFSSPIRQKPGSSMEMEEKTMNNEMKKSPQKLLPLNGDSIGVLLEQKLKELTSQEDDELAMGCPPKRSTAMILQELITALTAERPDIASPSPVGIKHERPARVSHADDHFSPGSVLEASFSSSSMDESSGLMVYTDSMDYSPDPLESLILDAYLLDSASSLEKDGSCERVNALVSSISRLLDSIDYAGGRLPESMLAHTKDVIVNAELFFGNATSNSIDGTDCLFIAPILNELETIANVIWTNINIYTGVETTTKVGTQFKGLLFDCLIECLHSNYGQYCNSRCRAWTRLPIWMKRKMIIGEFEKEINRWSCFAGMMTDEIIEWEMSHSLGKWTNFDVEAFETGEEVCDAILQILVDETLTGIWE